MDNKIFQMYKLSLLSISLDFTADYACHRTTDVREFTKSGGRPSTGTKKNNRLKSHLRYRKNGQARMNIGKGELNCRAFTIIFEKDSVRTLS